MTTLRDTQNYIRSAEAGVGVCEMPRWQVQQDLEHWQPLLAWLAERNRGQEPNAGLGSVDAIERREPAGTIDAPFGVAALGAQP